MTSPKRLAKQTSRSSRVAGNKKFTASHKIDFGQSPSPPSRSPSRPAGSAQVEYFMKNWFHRGYQCNGHQWQIAAFLCIWVQTISNPQPS
jgi:hypothetical protein